jgi:hypothetical protein
LAITEQVQDQFAAAKHGNITYELAQWSKENDPILAAGVSGW